MARTKLTGVAATAALVLLSVSALGVFVARWVVPTVLGVEAVTIMSGSMAPAMGAGALAYVEPGQLWQVGDVLTFDNGAVVTHRVVGLSDDGSGGRWYSVRGDANEATAVELIHSDQVHGRVVASIAMMGVVAQTLSSPVVIAFVLLVALAILAWPSLVGPRREAATA